MVHPTPDIIINADDFGMNTAVNEAVVRAFEDSLITSCTVMANGAAFEGACDLAHSHALVGRVGLHFVLDEMEPLTEAIKRMAHFAGPDGKLCLRRHGKLFWLSAPERIAVADELRAQIARCRRFGIEPTHLDSHHHIHEELAIMRVILPVLKQEGIRFVRPALNLQRSPDRLRHFYRTGLNRWIQNRGFAWADYFGTVDNLLGRVRSTGLPNGRIEVMVHPDLGRDGTVIDRLSGRALAEGIGAIRSECGIVPEAQQPVSRAFFTLERQPLSRDCAARAVNEQPVSHLRPGAQESLELSVRCARQITKVAVLNAAGNADYLYYFVSGLASQQGIRIDVIGSLQSVGLYGRFPNVRVFPLLGRGGSGVPRWYKVLRHIRYYLRLFIYVLRTDASIFHIQWLNRFYSFERLVIIPIFRILGKRLVFTAHNVDTAWRDSGRSGFWNRLTLRIMYACFDRVVAHSESIKSELQAQFRVAEEKIAVIPHGILGPLSPAKTVSRVGARKVLGIPEDARVALFFGNWERYKGLDILVKAVAASPDREIHLLIAGRAPRRDYYLEIEALIGHLGLSDRTTRRATEIPDSDLALFFTAADCTVLPYRRISQSGVPFLSYAFGVPVIAAAVGGLPEAVIPGITGMLYTATDVAGLVHALADYFASDLYDNLARGRSRVSEVAREIFSWDRIGARTLRLYRSIDGNALPVLWDHQFRGTGPIPATERGTPAVGTRTKSHM